MPTENELTRRAVDLVSTTQLGILMTCDERGYPHGRWMHVLPMHGLQRLYSMTARGSRKIEHITRHPEVSWIVTGDHEETVLLKGVASVDLDFRDLREVWDRLGPATQRYAVGPLTDDNHPVLVTIETRVQEAELICPSLGVRVAQPFRVGE